ncbi:MAG: glycerate kinase [Elusimicrobia bacterium]|nr:glycerate kinase [Elusimicrobiota bacterium]
MKIIVCPSGFKESLSSSDVAEKIRQGLLSSGLKADIKTIPISDGGRGTVDSFLKAKKGEKIFCSVRNPLGGRIKAAYGIFNNEKLAVIEMAAASGLELIPKERRNPMKTTTFGAGEMIKDALKRNCKKIIIGAGDSATVDGATGMAQAIGYRFLDKTGRQLPGRGENLVRIEKIDCSKIDKRIKDCEFIVATDVKNVLLGEKGASRVFAPQKGATPQMVEKLEKGLSNLNVLIKKRFKIDISKIRGSGAAGGFAGGCVAFLNAKIKSGAEIILENLKLEKRIENCDFVITGEGKIDRQTLSGKAVFRVLKIAEKYKKPVICLGGDVSEVAGKNRRESVVFFSVVNRAMPLSEAIEHGSELVFETSKNVGKILGWLKKA